MFRHLFSMRSEGARPGGWTFPSLRQLQAALAELPPGWIVLRSRRLRGADGPPWVKFIAFHPRKGIALIDLDTADPSAGIEPLDEFLARSGFGAFSAGDPPIVAVALGIDDIQAVAVRLDEAFAGVSPCGIKNDDWAEAVADLIATTPGLMLTRLAPPPGADEAQGNEGPVPLRADGAAEPPQASPEPREREPVAHERVERAGDTRVSLDAADMPPAPLQVGAGKFVWITASACSAAIVLGAIGLVYADWRIGQPPALADVRAINPPTPAPPAVEPVLADETVAPLEAAADAMVPPRKPKHHVSSPARPSWAREGRAAEPKANHSTRDTATRRRDNPGDMPAHVFYAIGDWFASLR